MLVGRATSPDPAYQERGALVTLAAVRDLARLETTTFHMERVLELTRTEQRLFGLYEAEDSILFVAAADVIAGVDLSELREGDLRVDADTVRLRLPRARVLSARLDTEHSFVHSRRTDVLANRAESLETEVRQRAERTLEAAALEAGILERAEASAQHSLEVLLRSLRFARIEIEHTTSAAER
jgi:Protein of unknown function (DUF4230)